MKGIPSETMLSWLKSHSLFPKIFWVNRSRSFALAGAGEKQSGPKIFGWHTFQKKSGSEWEDFAESASIAPAEKIIFSPTQSSQLPDAQRLGPFSLKPVSETNEPAFPKWKKSIETFLQKQPLEKIVLARRHSLEYQESPDPFSIAQALFEQTENAYIFLIQPTPRSIFLGASPERLFKRTGSNLFSEALAGTRKRGQTREEDARLKTELENSKKDQIEFAFVKEYLFEQLSGLCQSPLKLSDTTVLRTPVVQHLHAMLSGLLKPGIKDAEILSALHPTPAVAGWPKNKALDAIQKIEPFDRGLYAAPLGVFNEEESEWAVGLRSALIRDNTIHLYSGAGIVQGSDPEAEWNELDQKISLLKAIVS